jgi:hypothetical protein
MNNDDFDNEFNIISFHTITLLLPFLFFQQNHSGIPIIIHSKAYIFFQLLNIVS